MKAKKILSILLACVLCVTALGGAATATEPTVFIDNFVANGGPSLDQAHVTNLQATYDIYGQDVLCCAQKATNDGSGYIVYFQPGNLITSFSIKVYWMENFLYPGLENRLKVYALQNGASQYEEVSVNCQDLGIVAGSGSYAVSEARLTPSAGGLQGVSAIKIVLDPQEYGYVAYTLRLMEVQLTLEAGDTSGTAIPEDTQNTFVPGVTNTINFGSYTETRYAKYTTLNNREFDYSLALPVNFDPTVPHTVVLYLHGLGGDTDFAIYENYLRYIYDYCNGDCIVVAPIAYMQRGDFWVDYNAVYENPINGRCSTYTQSLYLQTDAQKFALELYRYICANFSVNRAFIVGYSMGAYGTWDIITRYPTLFDAAVAISGGSDPSLASQITDLPIWGFHGNADTVVDYHGTYNMYQAILNAGGQNMQYTEYEGGDHGICYLAFMQAMPWLFGTVTNSVTPALRDANGNRIINN